MMMFETVLKTSNIILYHDKILGTIWVPFGVPRNPRNWLIFCKNTPFSMISTKNDIIPWYPKFFFQKVWCLTSSKHFRNWSYHSSINFYVCTANTLIWKLKKTHFLVFPEKIGWNFVVNCDIMIWRFRRMMSTQWSFYRPSFEWYPKLPSFSFLSIFKSVAFFETHNFFLMFEKVPLMVPKTFEISIIKKFELWTF